MRIGLDAHLLGKGVGGVERVVRAFVERVPPLMPDHQFVVFLKPGAEQSVPAHGNVTYVKLAFSDPIVQRSVLLPWLARRHRLDLLHVQRIAPPWCPCPVIVHIHDLLPLTDPLDHPGARNALIRRLTPATVRRSARVLTVSETVAAEIAALYPGAKGKIRAIPNGISGGLFAPAPESTGLSGVHARLGLTSPYALYVGAITQRKNLETAIEGFGRWGAREPSARLVIAGMTRSVEYGAQLRQQAASLGLSDRVVFTGFVTDAECLSLLRCARVFLAPSRGEGFDLPPLEAMSVGTPVVCSDIAVHRELIDAGAALFFTPSSAEELARAIASTWDDPPLRATLRTAGMGCAARYEWDRAARALANLYLEMLPEPERVPSLA
jgi:glycosyltransferase involved in cell wall biosynthesis